MARRSAVTRAFLRTGATPSMRRSPAIVVRTSSSAHGLGVPAALWPSPMAARRRLRVDTAAGLRSSAGSASSAR